MNKGVLIILCTFVLLAVTDARSCSTGLYLQMNSQEFAQQENFKLMTTFPKKIFTVDDYDKPLDLLGLVPSAVIIVSRGQGQ